MRKLILKISGVYKPTPTSNMDADSISDIVCMLCGNGYDSNVLLLCDGCNKGFHTYCLNLPAIPVGNWYCPGCRRNHPKPSEDSSSVVIQIKSDLPLYVVFIYERVSSKGQNDPEHGRVGMSTQNNVLLRYALERGLVVRGTAQEVCSARDPNRLTQLKSICKMLKRGECVLVHSVSRFSRNLAQGREMLEAIHNAGGWVYSVTDDVSSYDERFLTLLQSAQYESDQLSQKMRDAYERIRQHGGVIGQPPFGWGTFRDEHGIRHLQVDPDEQHVLVKLRDIYDRVQNATQTAALLNDIDTLRRGKPWTKNQIVKSLGSLANNSFSHDLRKALEECC